MTGLVRHVYAVPAVATARSRGGLAPSDEWQCDLPVERAVLSAVLIDTAHGTGCGAWEAASAILQASDFYRPQHALLWEVMETLADRGEPLQAHCLRAELSRRNLPNTLTLADIGEISDEVPTTAWVEVHARIIADLAARRAAVRAVEEFAAAVRARAPLASTIAETMAALDAVPLAAVPTPTLSAAIERQADAYDGKRPAVAMVATGHAAIDGALGGGLAPGHYLLVGQPGTGKTTLALEWAVRVAKGGAPAYVWSGEQEVGEVATICTASLARVPFAVAANPATAVPRPTQAQLDALTEAMRTLHRIPLHVADETAQNRPRTVADIVAAVRAINAASVAKGGARVALIVIDNLLELEPRKKHATEWEGVVANMNDLRRARKLLRIPIVTIAHPNAEPTKGALYRRLRSGDIAGGKTAARKADGIMCLHREDKHPTYDHAKKGAPVPGLMQVYADKWRGITGGTFYCELLELPREHRFTSVGVRDELDDFADAGRPSHVRVVDEGEGLPGADDPLPTALEWAAQRDDRGPQDAAQEVV